MEHGGSLADAAPDDGGGSGAAGVAAHDHDASAGVGGCHGDSHGGLVGSALHHGCNFVVGGNIPVHAGNCACCGKSNVETDIKCVYCKNFMSLRKSLALAKIHFYQLPFNM